MDWSNGYILTSVGRVEDIGDEELERTLREVKRKENKRRDWGEEATREDLSE